jgi:catechol 2,3-dioxygenase-like lactoylglutathione lyase family enzyme
MEPVESMVAATYVADIDASRAFYELLGFREVRSGTAPTSAWSEMSSGGHLVLMVSTRPRLESPRLPLLFYFFFADLDAVTSRLEAAGIEFSHVGRPRYALGGEVRTTDPDGNTVLLGQRAASVPGPLDGADVDGTQADTRFSLLREAAAAVAAAGGATTRCQVSGSGWAPCGVTAEVKLADSAGDTVWACLPHAEEILVSVPGSFIANQDERRIAQFLANRQG